LKFRKKKEITSEKKNERRRAMNFDVNRTKRKQTPPEYSLLLHFTSFKRVHTHF